MNDIAKAIIITIASVAVQNLYAQLPQPDSIIQKFDRYRKNALQEKIYAHLDQQFYLIGETCWFKIYYVDGTFHKPLTVSKVAYVELLDKANVSVLQTKVKLKDGFGEGSVFLPATLQSGNYKFRCYTQWMKNFGAEFFFERPITIVNPFVKPEIEKSSNKGPVKIAFFPEGGQLVSNIKCKVGFKIADAREAQGSYSGAIINNQNDTIITFKPLKFGLGNFSFTPLPDQQYRAVIKNEKGETTIHPMPETKSTGYVTSLHADDKQLKINVTGRFPNADEAKIIYLFAHARNEIIKAELGFFQTRQQSFSLDLTSLPDGISHFTILDENQKPVCERLFFKSPSGKLNLSVNTTQQQFGLRKKVNLKLLSSVNSAQPAKANISVSVYKIDSLTSPPQQNIFEHLWLLSDLQGHVESPEYYFSNDEVVKEAADNLMLTHGWRKFKWDDVFSGKPTFTWVPEYRGHLIKAKVTSNNTNAAGVLTYLSVPGKMTRLYPGRSNQEGEVTFEVSGVTGQHKIVLQPSAAAQTSTPEIQLLSPFSVDFSNRSLPSFQLSSLSEKDFLSRTIAMQVQDIYHEENFTAGQKVNDSIPFYGKADEVYYLDAYTRFPVMEEVMREYVPGVFVRKRKDGFNFLVIDQVNGGVFENDPMILLDGVPLLDADKIMAVDPRKIKKLEVVKRRYYLGPVTMDGIVSYTTYNADIAGIELDPGSLTLNYEGLQLQREFHYPEYETQKQFNSRVPDKRHLLYWNPQFITGNDGVGNIEFYTSDVTGTFMIVAEGLTNDGYAGSTNYTFTVK